MRHLLPFLTATGLLAAPALATTVQVTVTGTVDYNQISSPPLNGAGAGAAATLTFLIDSDDYVNSGSFPTRGYPIDQSSFTLTLGSVSIGLQSPFPAGETPYFVIRNNDPAVDGFLVSTSVDFPVAVPIDQAGQISQFANNFYVTYGGALLPSLDVLDALGTYDFTGLQVFHWTIDDGPFDAMGLIFADITIAAGSAPCPADIDGSGDVGFSDVLALLGTWGFCGACPQDLNGNGQVDFADLLLLLGQWGSCP